MNQKPMTETEVDDLVIRAKQMARKKKEQKKLKHDIVYAKMPLIVKAEQDPGVNFRNIYMALKEVGEIDCSQTWFYAAVRKYKSEQAKNNETK